MKFTDRFMKLPIDLYDSEQAKLIGFNEDTNEGQSYIKVNPLEIAFYRPAVDDKSELTQTCLHFRGGESIHIKLGTPKFEELLNKKME